MKKIEQGKPLGFDPPGGGAYNNRKHLKFWESALFSGYYIWFTFHQNRRYLIFQGCRSLLIMGLTILERSWNYGNLPYSVANTYWLNFIKIGGIWIFWGWGGCRNPLLGGSHLTCDTHFRTRLSYSRQKSCVKIWYDLVEIRSMLIFRGVEGYMWPAMPIFELGRAIPVKSHVWKFGPDWLTHVNNNKKIKLNEYK